MELKKRLYDMPLAERAQLFAETEQMAQEKKLLMGELPFPFHRIPVMVKDDLVKGEIQELQKLINALNRIETFAIAEEGKSNHILFERLMSSLSIGGRALVSMCTFESEFSQKRRHRRIDTALNFATGQVKVVEVNQAAPVNIHIHDACQEIASHVLTRLDIAHTPRLLAPHILDWFVEEYKERSGGRFPHRIALPIEHGNPMKLHDLPNMAKRIEQLAKEKYGENLEIFACFPYDLKLSNETLYYKDKVVDLIWRNSAYLNQYRQEGKDVSDYEYVLRHPEQYLILNSTRSWLAGNWECFAIIWDDHVANWLELKESEVFDLRRIIPETHNIKYNHAKWEDIRLYKDEWCCRPSDVGLGKKVTFGRDLSKEDWMRLMEEKVRQDGVIFQRLVHLPKVQVLELDQKGGISEVELESDFCPHHVNGQFTGSALARTFKVKNNQTTNSILPVMMI